MALRLVRSALFTMCGFISSFLNSLTDLFLTPPQRAALSYLEHTDLQTLTGEPMSFKAKVLWNRSGAVIMAEAAELSSLKPQLDQLGVPLYAVVKEDMGSEVQEFRSYFQGEIFLDETRRFFGPRERRMGILGFLRVGVWLSGLRALRKGFMGNIFGEGFVLGGVFVIGREHQGILLEHRESEFGDKVDTAEVLRAARKIQELSAEIM